MGSYTADLGFFSFFLLFSYPFFFLSPLLLFSFLLSFLPPLIILSPFSLSPLFSFSFCSFFPPPFSPLFFSSSSSCSHVNCHLLHSPASLYFPLSSASTLSAAPVCKFVVLWMPVLKHLPCLLVLLLVKRPFVSCRRH